MEKFTYTIQNMLREKLALYIALNKLLERERSVIVAMDVPSLWKVSQEKKQMAVAIEKLRTDLFRLMKEKSGQVNGPADPANMSDLINRLPVHKKDKTELSRLRLCINEQKEDIAMRARENKRYLTDYLTIIDDVFSTIMDKKAEKKYSKAGSVLKNANSNYLINAEV